MACTFQALGWNWLANSIIAREERMQQRLRGAQSDFLSPPFWDKLLIVLDLIEGDMSRMLTLELSSQLPPCHCKIRTQINSLHNLCLLLPKYPLNQPPDEGLPADRSLRRIADRYLLIITMMRIRLRRGGNWIPMLFLLCLEEAPGHPQTYPAQPYMSPGSRNMSRHPL